MHGLPAGRGRKGGIPIRQRKKSVTAPDTVVPRPATCKRLSASSDRQLSSQALVPNTSNQDRSGHSAFQSPPTVTDTSQLVVTDTTTAQPYMVSASDQGGSGHSEFLSPSTVLDALRLVTITTSSQPFSVSQSASGLSASASSLASFLTQNQVVTFQSNHTPNINPFFVRAIEGNIRMCQGCRTSLRNLDGSIPLPPYNIAIARFERRSYRDKNGILQTPVREQAVHYHVKLTCVKAACPDFVPSSLVIPPDMLKKLSMTHLEYLRLVFGLSFQ